MKWVIVVVALLWTSQAFPECRIIEYPDHNEADCSDSSVSPKNESSQDNKGQKEEYDLFYDTVKIINAINSGMSLDRLSAALIEIQMRFKTYGSKEIGQVDEYFIKHLRIMLSGLEGYATASKDQERDGYRFYKTIRGSIPINQVKEEYLMDSTKEINIIASGLKNGW